MVNLQKSLILKSSGRLSGLIRIPFTNVISLPGLKKQLPAFNYKVRFIVKFKMCVSNYDILCLLTSLGITSLHMY